jgi:hypothetical protein
VDVILEEELQRQLSQNLRLRQRRGKNAEDDDKPQRKQIAVVDFCPRAGDFDHIGSICILRAVYANTKTGGLMRTLPDSSSLWTSKMADDLSEYIGPLCAGIPPDRRRGSG